jgi:SecD/SecF fusion protein
MKSIIYILIVLLTCGTLFSAFSNPISIQKQVIEIQSISKNTDSMSLNKSGLIIQKRLKDNGLQNFGISVNSNQKIIKITFNEKTDINEILPLLISNGKIELYETYKRADFIKLIEKEYKLFSMLNIVSGNSEINDSSAILGYCKPEIMSQVDSYITQHYVCKTEEDLRLIWSKTLTKNGDRYLYLLKSKAMLDKQQIIEASVCKINESNDLMITFNERGTLVWRSISLNNMNKSIAIVIDNMVYSTPVLKTEIKDGKCSISGNFTLKEITQLKSLINNDELPLTFKIVK